MSKSPYQINIAMEIQEEQNEFESHVNGESQPRQFQLSVRDLMVVTLFIAISFAVPTVVLNVACVAGVFANILTIPLLSMVFFTARARKGKRAGVERNMVRFVFRTIFYATGLLIVAGVALLARNLLAMSN